MAPNDNTLATTVDALIERQMRNWPAAAARYADLDHALTRVVSVAQSQVLLQFNPARVRSSGASLAPETLTRERCFLCPDNQPPEQESVDWDGRYKIQVNPYPIFPRHLTISTIAHTPQTLLDPTRLDDMLSLAAALPQFVIFYNGPRSGASAPHHAHFQAGSKGLMPLIDEVAEPMFWYPDDKIEIAKQGFVAVSVKMGRPFFMIKSGAQPLAAIYAVRLQMAMMRAMNLAEEPMQNILCWLDDDDDYCMAIFPRREHRPACYGTGEGQMVLSPAAVDMGGAWAIAREQDYNALTATMVADIYNELCVTRETMSRIIDCFLTE